MLPAQFVFLETLPLTPNGKLDRGALPIPDLAQPELEKVYVAPRTEVETLLVNIWAQVLGLERVGVHDNFFELGGHSLLATQVVSRIRQAFQVELPLRTLFEAPTVAELARRLQQSEAGETLSPIGPVERSGQLPLSFAQQRLWFLDQFEPDSPLYNSPLPLRVHGPLNLASLQASRNEFVRRH